MTTPVYGAIQAPPYWNGWVLSACMHTVLVGAALFLSHQLPTPQAAERDPIAVAFVTPQLTRTAPAHRPTMQKSPPTPTAKPKHVQAERIPKEPAKSKPQTQSHTRQTVSPQKMVHPSVKPVLQPVRETISAQPTTVIQTHTTSQPTVRSATVASQPMSQHIGTARQHTAAQVHAAPSHRKAIPGIVATGKVTPRRSVIHTRAINTPQRVAIPVRAALQRQSVNTLPSHEEKITRAPEEKIIHAPAMEAMKQQVARGKSHTAVKHVSSKPVHQPASLSSGRPVVATRTTLSYAHLTRKTRPVTASRSVSADGLSPELLAFSKLLREKIARTLKFPRLAKRLGYTGTTHVAIALSKTGIVHDLKITQPSGYEILDKAAVVTLEKVLQTTKPPESIEIEQLVIPIAFNLKRH